MHDGPEATTYRVDRSAIRNRRKELGLTQAALAARAKVSRPYITQLELGVRRDMRPPNYAALRNALDLDIDDRRLLALPDGSPRKE